MILDISLDGKRTLETAPAVETALAAIATARNGGVPVPVELYEIERNETGAVLRVPPFAWDLTTEEIGTVLDAIAAWRLARQTAPEYRSAEVWQEKLASTWTDPTTSVTLAMDENSCNRYARKLVIIRAALDAALITDATNRTIRDATGVVRTMTVAQMKGLLMRQGIAWETMFSAFAP